MFRYTYQMLLVQARLPHLWQPTKHNKRALAQRRWLQWHTNFWSNEKLSIEKFHKRTLDCVIQSDFI